MALTYKSSLARYRRYLAALEENATWRASIFVILSLMLILAMVLFALRPTVLAISELVTQIREQQALSSRLAAKIEDVRAAAELLSAHADKKPLLDQALPVNPDWLGWVKKAEGAASESGVVLRGVRVGPVVTSGNFPAPTGSAGVTTGQQTMTLGAERIAFAISIEGTYEQVRKYSEALESWRRLTVIDEAGYARNEKGMIEATVRGWFAYTKGGL